MGDPVAKCDEGYLCEVCGEEVESIVDSDLYLRYVIGLLDPETLHTTAERHLRCNPQLAQFIRDDAFAPVQVGGGFSRDELDPTFVTEREQLVTRGFRRLREIAAIRAREELSILEYPLPEVQEALRREQS